MDERSEIEPAPLSRWITLPLGLVLTPFTFLCAFGSSTLLYAPNVPPTFASITISSIFFIGSLWVFYLSLRLVFVNPKGKSSFINPTGLRAFGLVFALIPIVSLVTGSFWDRPFVYGIMSIIYFGVTMKLFSIAKIREKSA
ncbi:hypothetical protein [Chitinimonas taiwanensis]|uniref:hypothetical protein n=1 Tax=Chitinimonas taiwanensis TaxID=240412 RepID=UPI0035AF19C2